MITAADLARLERLTDLLPSLFGYHFGRFRVEPNPRVACSVLRGRDVVGLGWHDAYGGPHAEVEALRDAGRRARGATVYVTLEPCTTSGKTGPCVDALVRAGVARVVWAVADPNPLHAGKAAAALRARGIVAEGPAYRVDPHPEFTFGLRRLLASGRPYVLAKWAQSLDGRLARRRGRPAPISGPASWLEVHELRGRVEAVATGIGTVLSDDPRLDCRLRGGPPDGRAQPAAVVFDSRLRMPPGATLVRRATLARPLHLYVAAAPARRLRAFAGREGVTVTSMPGRDGRVDLARALAHLRAQGCRRLLVEAGGTLTGALLAAGLVDQVAAIVAPIVIGGADAPSIELTIDTPRRRGRRGGGAGRFLGLDGRRVGDDVWLEGYVDPASRARRRVSAAARS